jgi:hypothetical protein
MSLSIKEMFSEIREEFDEDSINLFSIKMNKIYTHENTQKRKTIFIKDKAGEPEKLIKWKDIGKNQKMEYIATYMKINNISGSLKSYAFSHIEYDENTKKIKSAKLRKLA